MDGKCINVWLEEQTPQSLVVRTETDGESKDLYFRADRGLWGDAFQALDFALVALSHFASASGRDLHIRGPVTCSQLDHIEEFLQIWSVWYPGLFKRIRLSAEEYIELPSRRKLPAVMMFSGGVDASFSLIAHHERLLSHLSKNIRMGILVVGWDIKHGNDSAKDVAYAKSRESLNPFGIDCACVATNWQQDFCPDWLMGFNVGVSSVLQTLACSHSCGIFANDISYLQELDIGPYGSHMVVNHLLGSASFPIIPTGGTHSRLERVRLLSKYPVLLKNLRVCYQENACGGNCGVCEKCVRTQLELIACGVDPLICFPNPLTADAISVITTTSLPALMLLEEILDELSEDHPFYPLLNDVTLRERAKYSANETDILSRLNVCDSENARLRFDIETMRGSRSWRYSKPLRSMGGLLRRAERLMVSGDNHTGHP